MLIEYDITVRTVVEDSAPSDQGSEITVCWILESSGCGMRGKSVAGKSPNSRNPWTQWRFEWENHIKSYKIMICVALFCHVVENQQWTKTVAARIIRWSRNTIVLPQDDMGWSWWVGLSPSGRGLCAWQPMPLSMRPQRRVNHTNQGWSCNHCCGKNHYKCGFGFVVGS